MSEDIIQALLRSTRTTEIIGARTMESVRAAFRGEALEKWISGLECIVAARLGSGAAINFAVGSVAAADSHGAEIALSIVPAGLSVAKSAGPRAGSLFFMAVREASGRLREHGAFRAWLRTVEELASLAPESAEVVLQSTGAILSSLDSLGFRAWVLNGIRQAGGEPSRRAAYFSQLDAGTLRVFDRAPDDIGLPDCERSLRAFLTAVWRYQPTIRVAVIRPGGKAPRRSSFDGIVVRVPELYGGYRGAGARQHFRAVLAHIAAHAVYTREKFPVGTLKPIQLALVGLIEDARVETLAAREFPGLGRLWRKFHHAQPAAALTAETLMARLSRALMDASYVDDDPWVNKGRMMFFEEKENWADQSISRRIGGLLGNDIGQMRIQFNPKTYIVEPSCRDDNLGLWDFGDAPPEQAHDAEVILESARIREQEQDNGAQKRENRRDAAPPASMAAKVRAVDDDEGIPIAKHPEWDHISGMLRNDWTSVLEFQARPAPTDSIDEILRQYADVQARIVRLVGSAKVSRPQRMRRQPQGDRLDYDACIRATIERRAGRSPDADIYETSVMRSRDLSVLVLLDISESTRDRVRDRQTSIIALEKAATVLLSEALASLGDPFAVHAFCSNGREEVRYYRVKDFSENVTGLTHARLAGLRGQLSTRLGAALRQAGAEVSAQSTHRKLVLVVTDGEPSDIDIVDRKYLVEDARRAVHELSHLGIDVFCVGLESGGESYLSRIFGRKNHIVINNVEALPEKLPMIYLRLTV